MSSSKYESIKIPIVTIISQLYMYEVEWLMKGRQIFGVKYFLLQSQLNGILCQLFSIPVGIVFSLCFLSILQRIKEEQSFFPLFLRSWMHVISIVIIHSAKDFVNVPSLSVIF